MKLFPEELDVEVLEVWAWAVIILIGSFGLIWVWCCWIAV